MIDARDFKSNHPGGEKILKGFYGKDASKAFHGELNFHTSAANHLSMKYRVAKIQEPTNNHHDQNDDDDGDSVTSETSSTSKKDD